MSNIDIQAACEQVVDFYPVGGQLSLEHITDWCPIGGQEVNIMFACPKIVQSLDQPLFVQGLAK